MINLKPCPFCGGNDIVYEEALSVTYCNDCGGELDEGFGSDWNTRPIEDALQSRIAELKKDLSNKEIEYTDLWDDALALQARIAELEEENERLAQLLHDEMSQLEIATEQLSRNNGEAQAKINALEADYVISNRELLVKQVEIQGLTARIAELEAAQRWIPVSERLPEPYTRVLACIKSGYMEVDYMYSEPIVDVGIADFNSLDNVTHWMPLPPSPESEVK